MSYSQGMRLVRVSVPEGQGPAVVQLARSLGIERLTLTPQTLFRPEGELRRDMLDAEIATPEAHRFVQAVLEASWFDPDTCSVAIRQPRAIVGKKSPSELTWPLVIPSVELVEDLWQFCHVTPGFVGRVLLASILLAYGQIHEEMLVLLAGLLFMPLLPTLMAIGLGCATRRADLTLHGLKAIACGLGLIVIGSALTALWNSGPVEFQEGKSWMASLAISAVVGAAAALAEIDNVGRRELLGLAASSQIAVIPSWLGISLVYGLGDEALAKALTLAGNLTLLVLASLLTFSLAGLQRPSRAAHGSARAPGAARLKPS